MRYKTEEARARHSEEQGRYKASHPDFQRDYYKRNPAKRRAKNARYRLRNPEKHKAHKAINNAVFRGTIIRPPQCESCGKKCKPQAHHHDYSKRFDVKWLCKKCHDAVHGVCR